MSSKIRRRVLPGCADSPLLLSNLFSFSAVVVMTIVMLAGQAAVAQEVPAETPVSPSVTEQAPEAADGAKKVGSVNIDTRAAYGQYNTILASFSLIQDNELFTYQLNSDLRRSNDFGHKNSSYYEGEVGFNGKVDLTERWKMMPELQVNNESHGMFSNTVYSREEKDRIIANIRNEYKPESSRWNFNLGTAHYVHRLNLATTADVTTSSFYKLYEEVEWEYIWSASNRFGFRHGLSGYDYSKRGSSGDFHMDNEVYAGFKVTEYAKVEGAFILDWDRNRDTMGGLFPSGRMNLSLVGLRTLSAEIGYSYDLLGFRPEEFYFQKKYILPTYTLPPQRVHRLYSTADYTMTTGGNGDTRLRKIRLKGTAIVEKNRDFYNYVTVTPDNVLTASHIDVFTVGGRGDLRFDTLIMKRALTWDLFYEYRHYDGDVNVTYRPSHSGGISAVFTGNHVVVEWENRYLGKVYVDPASSAKLDDAVVGMAEVQYRVIDSFHLFGRVDNLYNSGYSLRDGYPEPGRLIMAGLRIIF